MLPAVRLFTSCKEHEWEPRDPNPSASPPEEERSAVRGPLLPAPSPLSDQPKRSSPMQPGSNPAPSRAAAAGEGVRCFRLTSSPHASAAAVCMRLSFPWQLGAAPARQRPSCRAAAELCSCRRERDAQWALQGGHGTGSCQDSAGVSTVEGRMFWTKPLKLFFFFFKKI